MDGIRFTKGFEKQLKKLRSPVKEKFYTQLQVFHSKKFDSTLNDHALKGKYLGYRSINVTGDYRALYRREGEVLVFFAYIGTHSQLYG